MQEIMKEDIRNIVDTTDLSYLEGSTVLITGATGLLGKTIIFSLMEWNARKARQRIAIVALVRDPEKAERAFGVGADNIDYIVGDIRTVDLSDHKIDYIIHTASQTASRAFVEEPVETISVAIDGTRNLLEYAKNNAVKRMMFLSTMEVYGTPQTDEKVDESHPSDLDSMNVRACYPLSKRMCENICASYGKEYHVPFNILRLTQTFGPGINYNDQRVFAEFARCVVENRDIVLKTRGETKRQYLYSTDAVRAIFVIMGSDCAGEVFNVANEDSYCSIWEMANMVAQDISGKINVRVEEDDIGKYGYSPRLNMNLDIAKIKQMKWEPQISLEEAYRRLIKYLEENRPGDKTRGE